MYLILVGTGYDQIYPNVGKVKLHLTSGLAEVLNNHEEMVGEIRKNFVEIETSSEGTGLKNEKFLYFIQEGAFIITKQVNQMGLPIPSGEKTLYLYAKHIVEIESKNSTLINSIEKILKEKKELLEKTKLNLQEEESEKSRLPNNGKKIIEIQIKQINEDIAFFEKALLLIKDKNV
jgi:hypothetical protein